MTNRFIQLGDLSREQTTFLWQDRVPLGAITILEGDAGSGKSTVICDIAGRATTGRPMPGTDLASPPAGVVFLQGEDNPARTILPNVKSCGGDPSRMLVLDRSVTFERPMLLPDDVRDLETAIRQVAAKLLIIDPLSSFANFNLNDDRAVRRGLGPLADIAERHGVAVVLIRHLRKSDHRSALHRGAGSIAIAALARSVLVVENDPQSDRSDQHVLALTKSNVSTAPALIYRIIPSGSEGGRSVEWLGESHLTADELLGGLQPQNRRALFDACRVLFSLLAEGPLPANEVLKATRSAGISERTLYRAKSALQVRSLRRGSGTTAAWLWKPPDDDRILRPWREREVAELRDQMVRGAGDQDRPGLEYRLKA